MVIYSIPLYRDQKMLFLLKAEPSFVNHTKIGIASPFISTAKSYFTIYFAKHLLAR